MRGSHIVWQFVQSVPSVILLGWGAVYIHGFADELKKPFYNVVFDYESRAGNVKVRAGLVSIDIEAGLARAGNVRIYSPSGELVASAKSFDVQLPTFWVARTGVAADASGVELRLKRIRDGKWNVEDLLPVETEERERETAYSVHLKDARVLIEDQNSTNYGDWNLSITKAVLGGVQNDAFLTADAEIQGAGSLTVQMELRGDLIRGDLRTDRLELADLRNYLAAIPETGGADWLSEFDVRQASYSGSVSWSAAPDSEFRISGSGTATGAGLRVLDAHLLRAEFTGSFDEKGASGKLFAEAEGVRADGIATFDYAQGVSVTATGNLSAASYGRLEGLLGLPKLPEGVAFERVSFAGGVTVGEDVSILGDAGSQSAKWGGFSAEGVKARIGVQGEAIQLTGISGRLEGGTLAADIGVDAAGKVAGRFDVVGANGLKVGAGALEEFAIQNLNANGLVRGSLERPEILANIDSIGRATVSINERTWRDVVNLRGRLRYANDLVSLDAIDARGESGQLMGKGRVDLRTEEVAAQLRLNSIDLSKFPVEELEGIGFAHVDVSGALDKLQATGRMETYSVVLQGYPIPIASSNFSFLEKELQFTDAFVSSGSSLAKGNVTISLRDELPIRGSGELADFALSRFSDGVIQGLANGSWRFEGSLNDPSFEAVLSGSNLVVDRVPVEEASAKFKATLGGIEVEAADGRIGEGSVKLFGRMSGGEGSFHLLSENIPLSALVAYSDRNAVPSGVLDASGRVSLKENQLWSGDFEASLRNIAINDAMIGSGQARGVMAERVLEASGELGSLDGYYSVEQAKYALDSREISGTANVFDSGIRSLRRIGSDWLNSILDPEAVSRISHLDGKVSAHISLGGLLDDPNVIASLQLQELMYSGTPMGKLEASAMRRENRWNIQQFDLSDGPATFRLYRDSNNFIEEAGEISLDGELNNVELPWLVSFAPELGELRGTIDVPFSVSGQTKSPEIVATISGKALSMGELVTEAFDFGPFSVRDGEISSEQGGLRVRGLTLNLTSARIPFKYPLTFPEEEPLDVRFRVPASDLDALNRFFGELDTETSEGSIKGAEFAIVGTRAEPSASGRLDIAGSRVKFESVDTVLRDVEASVELKNDTVVIRSTGRGEAGGNFDLYGELNPWTSKWLPNSKLNLNDLAVSHRLENGTLIRGLLYAEIRAEGELMAPTISGDFSADQALLDVQGEFAKRIARKPVAFNPVFDVSLQARGGRVKSGLLDVTANGTGKLSGQFDAPNVNVEFKVVEGAIRLLTGPLRIEEGSVAHLLYEASQFGLSETRMPVDLRASTVVTASDDVNVQRYDVTLYITGDILGEDDLDIQVLSDPPGLTREEFVGIVGQKQLFAGGGGFEGNFEAKLKDILSVVSPVFLAPITQPLERAFGLDYIVVNLGSSAVGGIIVGKSLGGGFSLEYRQPFTYDSTLQRLDQISLTYRPQVGPSLLSRMSVSGSLNREGLVSFSLTYSSRFQLGRAKR